MTKLTEEARLKRNAYLRDWRKKNPKATRQHQINYWNKKAEEQEEEQEKKSS